MRRLIGTTISADSKLAISILTIAILFSRGNEVRGQVMSDHTTNTKVRVNQDIYNISGGIQAGEQLFHSFKQFSLDTDAVANFDHNLDIKNIFSRVTGGVASEIDGLIQTQSNASLFLINPAGIIFGANAQLNVGGSFIATTAEKVLFADGTEFKAIAPKSKPLLTVSSPIGLQYGNSGDVAVLPNANRAAKSSGVGLTILPNRTLALLGGNVSLARNNLNSISSNIEISSVKYGTVVLEPVDYGWQFDYSHVKESGRIELSDRAFINSSGTINFHGKNIDLNSRSGILNFTDLNSTGGTVYLEATESISLDDSLVFTQVGEASPNLDVAIAEAGGDIVIQAPQILFNNGSIISAGTLSDGTGGNITINAIDTLQLSSSSNQNPSLITTSTQGAGNGGFIAINTGKLNIDGGSQIQAFGRQGKGGTITVNAEESINISGTGILRSQDSLGNPTETLLTSGFTAAAGIPDLPIELRLPGESGNLIINASELTLEDSARISVNNYGLGNGGDIEITIANLNLDTASEITANTSSGSGGSISIMAEKSIILNRNSGISTTAESNGNGGNIFLHADNLLLLKSDRIIANADRGSGGNITINTQGFFLDPDSIISASSKVKRNGIVSIDAVNLDARLYMGLPEHTPLADKNHISTSCGSGENLYKNGFRNIGRGGIPTNLLQETTNPNTLGDLGNSHSQSETASSFFSSPEYKSISEANEWKINSQGNIELIAQNHYQTKILTSACKTKIEE